ncbi:MAG: 23S rRNA (uracil(1939)-C(5))-methyltransferase RlmD [Nitrospirota bacterium]|nr:23S rRNA (uracil(1939)-C(5))-methyltransferase RlmD [Nitrospirota bacterium]
MKPGENLSLQIEKMAFGGKGLARHAGRVVFVDDVLPGERVVAKVEKVRRDFMEGSLVEIVEPSPDRTLPSCPVAAECGGCQWMHASYPGQLRLKEEVLRDTLRRVGSIAEPDILAIIPSEEPWAYRHRGQFKMGSKGHKPLIGFYREQSHNIVDISHCPVFHPMLNNVLAALRKVVAAEPGWVDAIAEGRICTGFPAAETVLLLIPHERKRIDTERLFILLKQEIPHLKGLAVSKGGRVVSRVGDTALRFALQAASGPLNLVVKDGGFFQSNWPTSRHLVDTALDFLDAEPGDTVLDLYAGVGNFSLAFARRAAQVVAVEESSSAVECAEENATLNGVSNFEIMAASSEAGTGRVLKADLVHLDPPRQGAAREVLDEIMRLGPRKMVYTSCNPSILARDLKILASGGYRVGRVQPVDMFPQTYHIETVVELTRLKGL